MKTSFTLNSENAAAIAKYSQLIGADPEAFLNDLVHDYCTEGFADSGVAIGHLNSRGFKSRQAAETFLTWATDQIAQDSREFGWPITVHARIEEDSSGQFGLKEPNLQRHELPALNYTPCIRAYRRTDRTGRVVLGVGQSREHEAKFEAQTVKALFVLLGLFALTGCEVTPPAPRTSYPIDTDQPVYTGPQEYRPESYPDPEHPYSPAQNQGLPGLQPIPQPPN